MTSGAIRGPILTVVGAVKITGYDENGEVFPPIDLSGAGASSSLRLQLQATRDGYLAALSAELDEERRINADLRSQVWQLQRALKER